MEKLVIEMVKDKECKGSVRYAAAAAHVPTVYVSRKAADPMPEKIRLTVEAL